MLHQLNPASVTQAAVLARPTPPRRLRPVRPPGYTALHLSVGGVERIGMVRQGLPAQMLTTLASDMQLPRERLFAWLGIARATANRKIKAGARLSQDESERTLGLARLIGHVEHIVAESGEPAGFDAALWTAQWLAEPNPALGGTPPGEFLDTADGRALVAGLVAQMQSGAYA